MSEIRHRVSVVVGGMEIHNWNSYDIVCDMLTPSDNFTLELGPADPIGEEFGDVWDAVAPDADVQVQLDGVTILSGFVDDRTGTSAREGDRIAINGRDRAGRLVDESMPLIGFAGLSIEALALRIGSPWFQRVELSNARNRAVVIGKGRGAKAGKVFKEPHGPRKKPVYRKVEPGETRWSVLEYFCREMELLAWAAADGQALIVGQPNFDQEPTFRFFHGRAGSPREAEGNCASFRVTDSVGDRYSQIIAMGSNAGHARDYAERVVKRRGVASNGPGAYGIGTDFAHRKVMLIADDAIKNDEQAEVRATREMAERDASKREIILTAYGHAQLAPGAAWPTLFACDTMAYVESEVFGIRGHYLITQARFTRDRSTEMTELRLVPKGTLLRA